MTISESGWQKTALLTPQQMGEADRATIAGGVSGMALMENIALVDESLQRGREMEPVKSAARSFEQLGDYRIIREIGP